MDNFLKPVDILWITLLQRNISARFQPLYQFCTKQIGTGFEHFVITYEDIDMQNFTLFHAGMEPLFYGAIIFLGLASMLWKFKTERWLALFIEIMVFILVFKLHSGTMQGGFAATVAALLAGLIFPLFFRRT